MKGPAIHDSIRKEWEAALEAKRTVSASNRKVGLTPDLNVEARIFRNLQLQVKARKIKKDKTEKNFAPKVDYITTTLHFGTF